MISFFVNLYVLFSAFFVVEGKSSVGHCSLSYKIHNTYFIIQFCDNPIMRIISTCVDVAFFHVLLVV